jgi:hypothetical protein
MNFLPQNLQSIKGTDSASVPFYLFFALMALVLNPSPLVATQGKADAFFRARLKLKSNDAPADGKARFRKGKLEIYLHGRLQKYEPYEIEYFEELDPLLPPSEEVKAKALTRYTQKLEFLKKDDAPSWVRLGNWSRKNGLPEKATIAYKKAVELDSDNLDARREMKHVKDSGEWKDSAVVGAERWKKIKPTDFPALLKFGVWASKYHLPKGQEALDKVLIKDFRNVKALKGMRRYTARFRHKTKLHFPLSGRWQASPDKSRHHQKKGYAVYALDLSKVNEDGKIYKGRGRKLEDYYTWDAPVYAVADGVVVDARDGFKDIKIGGRPRAEKHNGVSIRHLGGEHSFYVHLKKGSLKVKVGDKVKSGQIVGAVGNSGGSARPHLHFTMAIPSAISIPWWCHDYYVVVDGTKILCKRGQPREGQTLEYTWQAKD